LGRYFRQLSRLSSAFVLVSDVAMATLGGKLKRKEKLSGRLADMLAWMYLASASLKRFIDQKEPEADRPLVHWACEHSLFQIECALRGILDNLPNRPAAWLIRPLVLPLGARCRPPSDNLGSQVARGLLEDRQARINLTGDIYVPGPNELGLGRLEAALDQAVPALAIETKIRDAVRAGRLDKAPGDALASHAVSAGVITREEADRLQAAQEARDEVIQVDSFRREEFLRNRS
jgi:acyl-CoA dehydrogenase